MKVRLHAFEPRSRANGPGVRAVAWFQGCSLGCPGCFNPGSHAPGAGWEIETAELAARFVGDAGDIEGVTFSGGEPFEQPTALEDVVKRLAETPLSICVFTGYTWTELNTLPHAGAILAHLDVVISGRYEVASHVGAGLLGSKNQQLHLLTDRYSEADLKAVPQREAIVHADGSIAWTGIARSGNGSAPPSSPSQFCSP